MNTAQVANRSYLMVENLIPYIHAFLKTLSVDRIHKIYELYFRFILSILKINAQHIIYRITHNFKAIELLMMYVALIIFGWNGHK